MQAACVDQQTIWMTVRLPTRAACGPALRIQSSHSVGKSSGQALELAALQLAGYSRVPVEGQPRSWGIDRGVCAFLAQENGEGTAATTIVKETLRQRSHKV